MGLMMIWEWICLVAVMTATYMFVKCVASQVPQDVHDAKL